MKSEQRKLKNRLIKKGDVLTSLKHCAKGHYEGSQAALGEVVAIKPSRKTPHSSGYLGTVACNFEKAKMHR